MPTEDHQIKPLPSQRAIWTQVYLSQKSPVRCESYLLRGPSSWWYLKIQDLQFCFKTFPRVLMASPLQCSCLENPRDGGAWWAAVYGVAQSRTRLKQLSSSSSCMYEFKAKTLLEFWVLAVWSLTALVIQCSATSPPVLSSGTLTFCGFLLHKHYVPDSKSSHTLFSVLATPFLF